MPTVSSFPSINSSMRISLLVDSGRFLHLADKSFFIPDDAGYRYAFPGTLTVRFYYQRVPSPSSDITAGSAINLYLGVGIPACSKSFFVSVLFSETLKARTPEPVYGIPRKSSIAGTCDSLDSPLMPSAMLNTISILLFWNQFKSPLSASTRKTSFP